VKILPRLYVNGMHGDVFYLASLEEEHMVRLRDHVRTILLNPLFDGIVLASTFVTPNHKFPWSMKDIMKNIREVDLHKKLLFIVF
jgi:hypothetical protein